MIVGVGESSATGHTNHTLGQKSGEEKHTLSTNEMPTHGGHVDPVGSGYGTAIGKYLSDTVNASTYGSVGRGWDTINSNELVPHRENRGGSQAHSLMQPYVVTNYIIKAKDHSLIQANLTPILDMFYPTGSVYETTDSSFNPNANWGGTWTSETIKDDFIVEEGTINNWTYRKWNSGIAECWGRNTLTFSTNNGWGSLYYETPYSDWSFPSSLFSEQPSTNLTRIGEVEGWLGCVSVNKYGISGIYLVRPAVSGAGSYTVSCHAKGLWKAYSAPTTKYKWKRTA